MSVVIRLARHGRKKMPFYRMVVADKEMPRDGRYLELVGTLNPLTNPETVLIKEERIKHWIEQGALPSDTVGQIIKRNIPGYLEEKETKKLERKRALRAKRKSNAKK